MRFYNWKEPRHLKAQGPLGTNMVEGGVVHVCHMTRIRAEFAL